MTGLSALDWWVIGVYLTGLIGFGWWLSRSQESAEDYFLGRGLVDLGPSHYRYWQLNAQPTVF